MKQYQLFKLSAQQEEMWINTRLTSLSYWNFLVSRAFRGKFDVGAFRQSLDKVIKRHSGLRTGFVERGTTMFQIVYENCDLEEILEIRNCICCNKAEFDEYTLRKTKAMLHYKFDPANELLFRVKVFLYQDIVYVIILFNHLICDYISTQIFWRDLVNCYNKILAGIITLEPAGIQYHEYSRLQETYLLSDEYKAHKTYWLHKINQIEKVDSKYEVWNKAQGYLTFSETLILPELMADLRSMALKKRVILSAIFQLAYYILLTKFSDRTTITILNIFHCRGTGKQRNADTIGLFADTLLNTIDLKASQALLDLLQQVHTEIEDCIIHSDVPYREVFQAYKSKFQHSPPGLQADFNMLKMSSMGGIPDGLKQFQLEQHSIATKFDSPRQTPRIYLPQAVCSLDIQSDLSLTIRDDVAGSKARLGVFAPHNDPGLSGSMLRNYIKILGQIAYLPGACLNDIIVEPFE